MKIKSKIIGAFLVLITITLVSSVYVSFNITHIKENVADLAKRDFTGITFLLEADRDSYQSNVALSQIINLKNPQESEKLIKDGVSNNIKQVRQRFDKFKNLLEKQMPENSAKFEEFDVKYNLTNENTQKLISLINSNEYEKAQKLLFGTNLNKNETMTKLI